MPTWAAEAFRRAVDASPDNVAFNYNLAAAYDRAEPRRAVDQWQRYLMLAGELPTERRRADEARKRLKQLVSDYPEEENR